jgi:hypothetical protein
MPRFVALLALVAVAGSVTACDGSPPEQPKAEPTTTPTPLPGFDTRTVTVARADFCGLVPTSAAELALGAPVADTSDYANGERSHITGDVRDVAHEFSCSWSAADGSTARAWVFAPRITRKQARSLVRGLGRGDGCSTPQATAFGKPSVATVCTSSNDVDAAYHGLFVDAWLSCSVSSSAGADRTALLDRTGEWCVQVASAVDTGPG